MDASLADFIQESTTATGTTQNIALAEVTGYGRFAASFAVDETCYYVIRDGDNAELGIGTVKAGNTLDRAATPLVTLESGVYDDAPSSRITLSGSQAIVACASAAAILQDIAKSVYQAPINNQTGTAHTLVLSDGGNVVNMDNAAANDLTVPPNSSVPFPVGTQIVVIQLGAGATTVVAGAGVTVNTSGSLGLRAQFSAGILIKVAVDTWVLSGDLA